MAYLASTASLLGSKGSLEEYMQRISRHAMKEKEETEHGDEVYISVETPNLKELFMTAIYEKATKEDKEDKPMKYFKLYGKSRFGHLSYTIGNMPDQTEIRVDRLILSGNNMPRVWIKLYEYCKKISQVTADLLLPPFENKVRLAWFIEDDLNEEFETTIDDFIDKYLEEFYYDDYQTDGPVSLYSFEML